MKKLALLTLVTGGIMMATACQKKTNEPTTTTDIQETAQQIGDVMASIDESGGSGGSLALFEIKGADRAFARLIPNGGGYKWSDYYSLLIPQAQATSCFLTNTFSSCTNNVITRTFGGCTIGTVTLDGTVTLTWSDAAVNNTCAITANGHSIARVPSFTLTGRRGGTLTVSKTGTNGQVITRTAAGEFSFTNDGIRRVIAYLGTTLFDFTTQTTAALTVSGSSRSGRTLTSTGGAGLTVTNNTSGISCTYVPTTLTWTNTCTCATSGSLSSTCSDGKSSILTITGCGTASFTMGTETEALTFDRCYGT